MFVCKYSEMIIENNDGIKSSVYRGKKLTYPVRNEYEFSDLVLVKFQP